MKHQDIESLEKEKETLKRTITLMLWWGVPVHGVVVWVVYGLFAPYLDVKFDIAQAVPVMLSIWLAPVFDKAWRIRKINRELAAPKPL